VGSGLSLGLLASWRRRSAGTGQWPGWATAPAGGRWRQAQQQATAARGCVAPPNFLISMLITVAKT